MREKLTNISEETATIVTGAVIGAATAKFYHEFRQRHPQQTKFTTEIITNIRPFEQNTTDGNSAVKVYENTSSELEGEFRTANSESGTRRWITGKIPSATRATVAAALAISIFMHLPESQKNAKGAEIDSVDSNVEVSTDDQGFKGELVFAMNNQEQEKNEGNDEKNNDKKTDDKNNDDKKEDDKKKNGGGKDNDNKEDKKPTATPKPKATNTPKPKATNTPKPKATNTPRPKPTKEETPTTKPATATPKKDTPTPKPEQTKATKIPEPKETVTKTVVPATETPVSTSTPKPEETPATPTVEETKTVTLTAVPEATATATATNTPRGNNDNEDNKNNNNNSNDNEGDNRNENSNENDNVTTVVHYEQPEVIDISEDRPQIVEAENQPAANPTTVPVIETAPTPEQVNPIPEPAAAPAQAPQTRPQVPVRVPPTPQIIAVRPPVQVEQRPQPRPAELPRAGLVGTLKEIYATAAAGGILSIIGIGVLRRRRG